jgi:hypothetical protein
MVWFSLMKRLGVVHIVAKSFLVLPRPELIGLES